MLISVVVMAIGTMGAALIPLFTPDIYAAMKIALQWIALPLLSAWSAGLPARGGLSHYLAWIVPPVIVAALPWLIIGIPLTPGVMLLSAFLAMIGASAGAVMRRRAADTDE